MNNAKFYGKEALAVFRKYESMLRSNGKTVNDDIPEIERFAMFETNSSSTAFKYEIGEIVSVNGRYMKVVRFDTSSNIGSTYNEIVVTNSNSNVLTAIYVPEDEWRIYKTEVPQELFDLVAEKIPAKCPNLDRCPLKDEGACMKGGEND